MQQSNQPGRILCGGILSLSLVLVSGFAPEPRLAAGDGVARVAEEVDRLVAARWQASGIRPAEPADDAEFLRRVSLDLGGRIPTSSEVRDFLADDSSEKRRALVDRQLGGAAYIVHSTNLWRAAMIPEADTDPEVRQLLPGFEAWLRARIAANRNHADIVREVITLPLAQTDLQPFSQADSPTPVAFYQAKAGQPENLAAATARVFLGLRIECAQCHDHFFDSWKQREFWEYAAFFASVPGGGMLRAPVGTETDQPGPHLLIPGTEQRVVARFLDGREPDWSGTASSREILADWVTAPANPYFARATVNRIWAHVFGAGLVEPLDDFSDANPPSHPAVLDLLAREFTEQGHDVKFILRVLTATRTYQLSSRMSDETQQNPRMFARMSVKSLTPEQLFDSIAQAVGYQQPFDPEQPLNFNNDPQRQDFIEAFANSSESTTEKQVTVLQALQMMNGELVADATGLSQSRTLAAVAEAPFLDSPGKIEALFLATLNRPPAPEELQGFAAYVDGGGTVGSRAEALGDVFWALLNSSEFLTNH